MQAVANVRRYIDSRPDSAHSAVLRQLATSLSDGAAFPLERLYGLELEAFELAMQLVADWRLERYYTPRLRLGRDVAPAVITS